jgi:hypothetical protein
MTVAAMVIAAIVFVALLAVAIAQLIWAMGGAWPIRDPALLARTVAGRPGLARVPRLGALLTCVTALVAGTCALALADPTAGGPVFTIVGGLLAAALLGRGVLGYTAGWRARRPEEPYATLDRKNYSPLALAIGAGFAVLVILRLI